MKLKTTQVGKPIKERERRRQKENMMKAVVKLDRKTRRRIHTHKNKTKKLQKRTHM